MKICGPNLGDGGNRPEDCIARPTSLTNIHTITMERLNTYEIPQEPVEQRETSVVSANFGRFFVILRVNSGSFWCKWEGCEGISDFESPRIIDWCFIKDLRWLIRYPKSQVVHNVANW